MMKNMMNGTKDLMLNAMKCKMIKVGLKKDSFVNATKRIKIKIGCKKDSSMNSMQSINIKDWLESGRDQEWLEEDLLVNAMKIKVGWKKGSLHERDEDKNWEEERLFRECEQDQGWMGRKDSFMDAIFFVSAKKIIVTMM